MASFYLVLILKSSFIAVASRDFNLTLGVNTIIAE